MQTKYYRHIYNSKYNSFELVEITLNKENWFYVQLDASIRYAFMKYVGVLPETVVIGPRSNYINKFYINIIRPNLNNLEETSKWLKNRIFILDELNQQANCNSTDNKDTEDWIKYEFKII